MVLGILGVLGSAIGLTLLRQQRFYRGTEELVGAREGVRDAIEILSTDIRGMSIADTARLLADSAVEMFASVGSSVVCHIAGSEIGLPAGTSPVETHHRTLLSPTRVTRAVPPGLSRCRQPLGAPSDSCVQRTFEGDDVSSDGFARRTMSMRLERRSLSFVDFLSDHVHRGAPVRFIRRGRYSLYRSSDGSWYLGYRRCNALGPSVCGAIQP
jgi:hypothetical protein